MNIKLYSIDSGGFKIFMYTNDPDIRVSVMVDKILKEVTDGSMPCSDEIDYIKERLIEEGFVVIDDYNIEGWAI